MKFNFVDVLKLIILVGTYRSYNYTIYVPPITIKWSLLATALETHLCVGMAGKIWHHFFVLFSSKLPSLLVTSEDKTATPPTVVTNPFTRTSENV